MRAALYLDDDSGDLDILKAAGRRAWDITRAEDSGMSGKPDIEHLAYATSSSRVMVSGNLRDFAELHEQLLGRGDHHAGILLVHQQRWSVGEILRRLERLLDRRSAEEMVDRLEWLSDWGSNGDD